MTELLYLPDNDDVTEFEASVIEATEEYVVLDGTYFYPESGGQPADTGTLDWDDGQADVVDVQKSHGDIHHFVENLDGERPEEGTTVRGTVDETRRNRHRRMHTAQHVVSRVVFDEFDATTAGNQIHADRSRIDFEPVSFTDDDIDLIEENTNRILAKDLSVTRTNRPREDVEQQVPDARKLLDLIPESVDPLRVVEIADFDRCPCGGTHVASLGDIGRIRITDRTSKGKDTERIEFELVAPSGDGER